MSDAGVSDTDVRIFCELGNPSKVNIDRLREEANAAIREAISEHSESEQEEESQHDNCSDHSENSEENDDNNNQNNSEEDEEDDEEDDDDNSEEEMPQIPQQVVENNLDEVASSILRSPSVRGSSVVSAANSVHSKISAHSNISHAYSRVSHASHASSMSGSAKESSKPKFSPFTERVRINEEKNDKKRDDAVEILEKQQILLDMERVKLQGIKLSKDWTVDDRIEDMQFELRRHLIHQEETNNIKMMRDGLRLACTGFELLNQRMNLLELDGWASEVCKDIEKYDSAMGRIYRKYWKHGYASSPEMEIAMGLIGSIGMYHFKKKFSKKMMRGAKLSAPRRNPVPSFQEDSSSDEEAPP